MNAKKIMLGSAQFGMDYGISNHDGRVNEHEIANILKLAHSMQINQIDTASLYGTSESILGKLANHDFKIITKLSPINSAIDDISEYVRDQCLLSLQRLRRDSCEGLLVHHADDLLGPKGEWIYHELSELKVTNKIKKIGVSVYSPAQVYVLLDRYQLDIIQFPLNILDQRFIQNQLLSQLKKHGVELHVRSIFLQGLLLMDMDCIPVHFQKIKPSLLALRAECASKYLSLRQALIEFVASREEIDHCIFGVTNYQQLYEIINDFVNCKNRSRIQSENYKCDDLAIINPMNWNN